MFCHTKEHMGPLWSLPATASAIYQHCEGYKHRATNTGRRQRGEFGPQQLLHHGRDKFKVQSNTFFQVQSNAFPPKQAVARKKT